MSETMYITYVCKIRGFSRYKLSKNANGDLTYITEVPVHIYSKFSIIEFLNPVYAQDTNKFSNANYEIVTDMFTINIPIMADSVSTSDFNGYEIKQVPSPTPPVQTTQWNGIPTGWSNPVYKKHIDGDFITEPKGCLHEWTMYMGLNHSFEFCKKCDEKRNS